MTPPDLFVSVIEIVIVFGFVFVVGVVAAVVFVVDVVYGIGCYANALDVTAIA